jgi:hypothetical protein
MEIFARFPSIQELRLDEATEHTRDPFQASTTFCLLPEFTTDTALGLPIGQIFENPPIFPISFVTDAAGASWEMSDKGRINTTSGDRRAAAVEHDKNDIVSISIVRWPDSLMFISRSRENLRMSSKSATLETVGILLPFLSKPKELAGRHILIEVDNLAVVFAWEKRYSKSDPETSLLIRCLHVIEARLECKIYVTHLRRLSNQWATLADSLSRQATTTESIRKAISRVPIHQPKGPLWDWLNLPIMDWDLPNKMI